MTKIESYKLIPYVPEREIHIEDYADVVGRDTVEALVGLAEPVAGRSWTHINSTAVGGGVAEILQTAIPLAKSLGIDAQWQVLTGNEAFFRVTKKFHNSLQGLPEEITNEDIFETYLDIIASNGKDAHVESDVIVVHDPQPIGLVTAGVLFGTILWRCHIDTSAPNQTVWRFLLPYINQCSGAIFTMPEFVGDGVHVPHYEINPCIDPLAPKNRPYGRDEAKEILSPLMEKHGMDPDRPIIAAISRYDPHKNQAAVLKAFQKLRESKPAERPYLVFLGNTASDDPEGATMLGKLQIQADDDPDIIFWVNVDDNDRVVGSLNSIARAVAHVSTKEGFGLVVSEALWQGTPVIGSRVGGIVKQVIDGQTGYVVDPKDTDTIATRMRELLDDPDRAETLGKAGHEHVRDNFLITSLLKRHIELIRYATGVDSTPPSFRLNGHSYAERLNKYRVKSNETP